MKCRFIGQDGSMGLKHGEVYTVRISQGVKYLYVCWGERKYCPYSSLEALTANWEDA